MASFGTRASTAEVLARALNRLAPVFAAAVGRRALSVNVDVTQHRDARIGFIVVMEGPIAAAREEARIIVAAAAARGFIFSADVAEFSETELAAMPGVPRGAKLITLICDQPGQQRAAKVA